MAKFKRQKTSKRRMAMYHHSFSFREPYQVLLDGNFIHASLSGHLDTRVTLPRILAGRTKPMTTQCVLAELRSLGEEYSGTALVARKLEKRRCPHTNKPVDAATCIAGIIGPTNEHRYCVATQDVTLRKTLREVPGVPLVLISKNVVILEAPSKATEAKVKQMEAEKSMPDEFEKKVLKKEGLSIEPEKKEKTVKKKRKKEPNPLSVKKAKVKPGEAGKSETGPDARSSSGMDSEGEVEEPMETEDASSKVEELPVLNRQPESTELKEKKKRPRKRKRGKKALAVGGSDETKGQSSGSDSE